MRRITLLTNPDLCNLHCPLCFLRQRGASTPYGEMPFELARAAIEKYTPQELIPSTMGEPLLYSKFKELLDFCRARHIKINLTTNGTFPGLWNSRQGMVNLLTACSDIKISTLAYEVGGISQERWRENVEQLLEYRRQSSSFTPATLSLQVTLHRENIDKVETILHWAENAGIQRIKWNPVVFLENTSQALQNRFRISTEEIETLRQEFLSGSLHSSKVKNEGSLFFKGASGLCPVGGKCDACPFIDEIWIWPDGHEDHCPNPQKRWKKT